MLVLAGPGADLEPVLNAAGIGGLAIGSGAQGLVKDVISGSFLLPENQVRVGGVVNIGGGGGLPEAVPFRTIVRRGPNGNLPTIPHGTADGATNTTRDCSRYVFALGVAHREDPDEAMRVPGETGEGLRRDPDFGPGILEPPDH